MIQSVRFIQPIHLGGDVGDLAFWKRDKHGHATDIIDTGGMWLDVSTPDGRVVRVPFSNIAYMTVDKTKQAVKK